MNNVSYIQRIFAGLTLLALIPIGIWCFIILCKEHEKNIKNIQISRPVVQHVWGVWSKPEITSDWNHGTQLWQIRTCNDCGEAEMRKVQVSADGSYKK